MPAACRSNRRSSACTRTGRSTTRAISPRRARSPRGGDRLAIGLLYRNPDAPRYDQYTVRGLGMSREQKVAAIERELDRFAI